jgi:hypothetical protein
MSLVRFLWALAICSTCFRPLSQAQVDFSDLILAVKDSAHNKLTSDAYGKVFIESKPWAVFPTFVEHGSLAFLLRHDTRDSLLDADSSTFHGMSFHINPNEQSGLSLLLNPKTEFKAENRFYLVRVLKPRYVRQSNSYVSFLWLKDRSWTTGFQVFISFYVKGCKAHLLNARYYAITHVEEE